MHVEAYSAHGEMIATVSNEIFAAALILVGNMKSYSYQPRVVKYVSL